MTASKADRPATAQEIVSIVGPLDDLVLAGILRTGATQAQVLEAFTWATADDVLGSELERACHGVVGEVYEILKAEEDVAEEP